MGSLVHGAQTVAQMCGVHLWYTEKHCTVTHGPEKFWGRGEDMRRVEMPLCRMESQEAAESCGCGLGGVQETHGSVSRVQVLHDENVIARFKTFAGKGLE